MKRLIYQVYVGKKSKLYDHCVASVKAYCKKYGIDHEVQKTPILMIKPDVFQTNRSKESYEKYGGYLPIYEKENAFAYLKNYDQVAIIDADIWIRPDAPNIFEDLEQYGNLKSIDWKWNDLGAEFFNMGMMVMNKRISKYLRGETPSQFIRRPEFKPFVDGLGAWKWSTDQTLLNTWVKEEKMPVKNMDWKWNGLFTANTKIKECHFVHFFLKDKLPNRGENVDELRKLIE